MNETSNNPTSPSPSGRAGVGLSLLAAITFFTRIPLWKLVEIPGEAFRKIIGYWPLTGWITGGITGLVLWGCSYLAPPVVAVILAFVVRLLLTGAFHEDGLGDFFDGFGGGRTKDDILRIMKDSHVGSYALIGIVVYYLLLVNLLASVPARTAMLLILSADPLSKMLTALMINYLPYARKESESKAKTIYDKLTFVGIIGVLVFGLLPMGLFLPVKLWCAGILSLAMMAFIFIYIKKKIQGYTGDICGATTLLCEVMFYLGAVICIRL